MSELEDLLRAGPPAAGEPGAYEALVERSAAAAEAEGLVDVAWTEHDAPTGPLLLAATERGLVAVGLLHHDLLLDVLGQQVSPRVLHRPARLDRVRRQLDEYFAHERQDFDVPLDWALSQGFRRQVLEVLTGVSYGETVSYGELATRAGNPRASRAVGSAMATNPLPIVVPCHRVIRSDGSLGHYGGGVAMKHHLLELEGASVPDSGCASS